MKLSLLSLALLLVGIASAQIVQTHQSTDDDGNVVFSVQVTSDGTDSSETPSSLDSSPFRFFRSMRPFQLFANRPAFPRFLQFSDAPEEKDPFPMFERLFSPMTNLADSPSISIEVNRLGDDSDDDDDDEEENPAAQVLSSFFTRISSIFDTIRQQQQSGFHSQDSSASHRKGRRLGGCTLLQACGSDIDSVCGYAKRINVAQAIPRCLSAHRPQLSESCGQYIDRFYSNQKDESSETATATESSTEESEATEQPAPVQPTTPQDSCHQAAKSLCPTLHTDNMVAVMSCLFNQRERVPELCLNHIKDTAAFNCAIDAERFCPGVTNRRAVGRCLKPHLKELSESCLSAVKKLHPKKQDATTAPAPEQPATVQSMAASVKMAEQASSDSSSSSSASSFFSDNSLALGLGMGAFVVVAVVAAIVTIRRRRRAQRIRLPVVSTVQLMNPTTTNN